MLFWSAVEQEPHQKPSCAEESRKEKGPPPPKMGGHPRNGEWSDNGANIRAGIEDTGCQRSLLFGKPLGDSLYRAGKFPDSPSPSKPRANANPMTELASACPIAARLQMAIDMA